MWCFNVSFWSVLKSHCGHLNQVTPGLITLWISFLWSLNVCLLSTVNSHWLHLYSTPICGVSLFTFLRDFKWSLVSPGLSLVFVSCSRILWLWSLPLHVNSRVQTKHAEIPFSTHFSFQDFCVKIFELFVLRGLLSLISSLSKGLTNTSGAPVLVIHFSFQVFSFQVFCFEILYFFGADRLGFN